MPSIFRSPKQSDVENILSRNNLPVEDIPELNLDHFFGCGEQDRPSGVVGLEVHGKDGLLRSLSVSSDVQGSGCGAALVAQLEKHAQSIGIKDLYLLTETAEEFFQKKGYLTIDRELASDDIKRTREFSELCPASATLMRKSM